MGQRIDDATIDLLFRNARTQNGFLDKPPVYYPFLKSWQEMVKAGGTREEAKKLADGFQDLLVDVVLEQKEVEEQNDIIRAKALPGTKKKEPANLPHFVQTKGAVVIQVSGTGPSSRVFVDPPK